VESGMEVEVQQKPEATNFHPEPEQPSSPVSERLA